MAFRQTCCLELPVGFRAADILRFHGRDRQAFAERVEADTLEKGLLWSGQPACLSIRFRAGLAEVEMLLDGAASEPDVDALSTHVGRMIGLDQPVDSFERAFARHPHLGPLIARQIGLRVPLAATPFEALTWAITGQQISVSAALSIRRKLIRAAGAMHASGLACYPDAARLAMLGEAGLRAAGLSQTKAGTLIAVSDAVLAGKLPLDTWQAERPVDLIRERLLAIRGIGPWTVNYTLLRGFGWLDGSLHGDVAVRRALQQLLKAPEKVGEAEAKAWLDAFSPWRALVGAHLWASLGASAAE